MINKEMNLPQDQLDAVAACCLLSNNTFMQKLLRHMERERMKLKLEDPRRVEKLTNCPFSCFRGAPPASHLNV